MALSDYVTVSFAILAIFYLVVTAPFVLTAISYRHRDNGLAYLLLVLGVGTWNGMAVAQLLSPQPLIKAFFAALAIVGALLAGLGWFLFASTASRTPDSLDYPSMYALVAILVGLDVVLAVTSPVHDFYWAIPSDARAAGRFVAVVPGIGYWLHAILLASLFGAGAWLFTVAWRDGLNVRYSRAYAIAGAGTAVTVLVSAAVLRGRLPVASIAAGSLALTGWIQATRGDAFRSINEYVRSLRTNR